MKKLVRDIMNEEISNLLLDGQLPKFSIGQWISVKYETENKDHKTFRGIIISKENKGISSNISVFHPHSDPSLRILLKFFIYSPLCVFVVDKEPRNKYVKRKRFDLVNNYSAMKLKKM